LRESPGNERMRSIQSAIHEGAMAFLRREYGILVYFVVIVAAVILLSGLLWPRSEEHTSELQSRENLVCRLLLEKKNTELHTAQVCCDCRVCFALLLRRPPGPALFPYTTLFRSLRESPGNERMRSIQSAIHEGAMAFLRREYGILVYFVVIVAAVILLSGLLWP